MHDLTSCFVLGFHGCDFEVARKLVLREDHFRKSENSYDWLGHGIYFWLENPLRACEWTRRSAEHGRIQRPAVVDAVIDLGNCLDLTTSTGIEMVRADYAALKQVHEERGDPLPANEQRDEEDGDRLIRRLDCAVINMTCKLLEKAGTPVDTVKGMFTEGGWAFEGACIKSHTHTQVAVRNPDCIRGVFFPPRQMLGDAASLCNDTRV